ncbi:MAG: NAD(P)H-dependent glycerol-3-phosphate dehydrogenase [Pseudomonadota bacterium]
MDNPPCKPITVLGAGSWGTALALYLARLHHTVRLWTHDAAHAKIMNDSRANTKYLPNQSFPDSLQVTNDLTAAIADNYDILIAVPSAAFRTTITALKPLINDTTRILWATKGLDLSTGELLHDIATQELGAQHPFAVLSGPSFATEVAAGLPTAVVIASTNLKFAEDLMCCFNSQVFRVYLSTDITGVEIGGAVKNVLAIAAGITDGMQLGANARSALITRGLAEMIRLGTALGSHYETFTGLAGLGDLVLTCTDNQSRNRRFGLALGNGKTITQAEHEIGQVIEGKRNAELVLLLAKKANVEMPITETVWKVLQEKITIKEALQNLMSRAAKGE